MRDSSKTSLYRYLLFATLLLPQWAQAQSEQLYQVELLVFSRPAGAGAEHWDAIPELAYPARSRFLSYPGEQVERPTTTSTADNTAAPVGGTVAGTSQPAPFTTLAAGQRRFAGKAAAMQRSGRYRMLFHETWIQPMGSQASAMPIVLDRSGDGGPWPALQGSIKLYLSRYFYLDTNLWLNTQGEYLPGDWRMPAPPLAPASPAQQRSAVATVQPASLAEPADAEQVAVQFEAETRPDTDLSEEGANYPYRHAVQLKQTRRMRSGQVVYIDHPLLGVLVTITPLESAPEG